MVFRVTRQVAAKHQAAKHQATKLSCDVGARRPLERRQRSVDRAPAGTSGHLVR